MTIRSCLLALTILGVAGLAGPAMASPCQVPALDGGGKEGDRAGLAHDRAALSLYEACLSEEQEVLEALDPEAARTVDRQRQAAASLRRTLDAWQKAMDEAGIQDRDR